MAKMVLKFWYKLGHFKTGHVTIVCDRQMQLLQHVHRLHTMRHVSKTAKRISPYQTAYYISHIRPNTL